MPESGNLDHGDVSEWPKVQLSKSCVGESPPPPPYLPENPYFLGL